MVFATVILGWIGVLIFLTIILTFQRMAKNNEYAFLHLLMAMMYATWLPLPWVLYQLLNSDVLLVGTVFGSVYLILLVTTMALQTGHISFISRHNEEGDITDVFGNYMMAMLSNPFESLLGVFKSIWAIFLGISFWQNDEILIASVMILLGLFVFYYLFIALDASLVKRVKLFTKVKPNPIIINLETLSFFVILMSYITINI